MILVAPLRFLDIALVVRMSQAWRRQEMPLSGLGDVV
jgi:hypothetical protein